MAEEQEHKLFSLYLISYFPCIRYILLSMLKQLLSSIFILAFLILFLYVVYFYINRYLELKYQNLYSFYDDRYSRGLKPGCLPGCTPEGECPNGNFCYADLGKNPKCCAYDFQCKSCKNAYDKK